MAKRHELQSSKISVFHFLDAASQLLDKSSYAQHLRWKDFTLFDRLAYFPSLMT
jgi:hypothetical protein